MGSILSFPVLCIANFIAYWKSVEARGWMRPDDGYSKQDENEVHLEEASSFDGDFPSISDG